MIQRSLPPFLPPSLPPPGMVREVVDEQSIAEIVSRWTGIPVNKLTASGTSTYLLPLPPSLPPSLHFSFLYRSRTHFFIILEQHISHLTSLPPLPPSLPPSVPERQKLLSLADVLHERVVGQEEAVEAVAQAVLRSRAGLSRPEQPTGSFLFLGMFFRKEGGREGGREGRAVVNFNVCT